MDLKQIAAGRLKDREEVAKGGFEAAVIHELKHIADALEAIRHEIAGISQVAGTISSNRPSPK